MKTKKLSKKVFTHRERVFDALLALEAVPLPDQEFTAAAKAVIRAFGAAHGLNTLMVDFRWTPFVKRNAGRVLNLSSKQEAKR